MIGVVLCLICVAGKLNGGFTVWDIVWGFYNPFIIILDFIFSPYHGCSSLIGFGEGRFSAFLIALLFLFFPFPLL